MREDLLGLSLDCALETLRDEGVQPRVTITNAPRRAGETRGMLRVVYASGDGAELTAARFLDPIADREEGID